ncbi:MAG: hypothetical protein LIP08_16070 [Bacteroides sp.]|nr:hypothetical protein [Bacteroides sp.]
MRSHLTNKQFHEYPVKDIHGYNISMRTIYLIIFFLFFYCFPSICSEAIICFCTDIERTLTLYRPIDGVHNPYIANEVISLSPDEDFEYRIEVNKYTFIRYHVSGIGRQDLLLFPGDKLNVICEGEQAILEGNHADAQDIFKFSWSYERVIAVDKLFEKYRRGECDLPFIEEQVLENFVVPFRQYIDSLKSSTNYTEEFRYYTEKYGTIFFYDTLYDKYAELIFGDRHPLSSQDSLYIQQRMDQLFRDVFPFDEDLVKVPRYLFLCGGRYRYTQEKPVIELPEGITEEDFGVYSYYLNLPYAYHGFIFSYLGTLLLNYGVTTEANIDKLYTYVSACFPDSEYVQLFGKRLRESEAESEEGYDIHFLADNPSTLLELVALPELSGKYLYIDCWATWCAPCKAEFVHKDKMKELLGLYKDVACLYISIDDKCFEEAWKKQTLSYKLEGYHLQASSELIDNIRNLY